MPNGRTSAKVALTHPRRQPKPPGRAGTVAPCPAGRPADSASTPISSQLRHARLLIGSPVLATGRKLIVDPGIGQELPPLAQIGLSVCQPPVSLGCDPFGFDVRIHRGRSL